MKNITVSFLIALFVTMVSACSSNQNVGEAYSETKKSNYEREVEKVESTIDSVPSWFLEISPYDENGFYSVAKGQSTDMTFAMSATKPIPIISVDTGSLPTTERRIISVKINKPRIN